MRLAVAEQLKRRSAAWALCQPLLGTLFSWPCSNSLEAESGKNMQPCGVLLSRGFGDLLALVEDVLSLCPMTAIVCEGMRVRFAAPHAVTTVAGDVRGRKRGRSNQQAQASASSHLWRDASLLLGTTGWCVGGRGSLSTVRSFRLAWCSTAKNR